ncbi:hypothetical protein BC936DRAFT_147496 [Jimgerdemannia flammicorona]|uniref:Uncharacterized protein n=1 Tax=Jimgerdemannia flammicorona TaxID=994334 RepID=A0A433D574_9FUNG|nr:hypothetical protein BC936DRAFT_147496 [Jimgerdemannia flammicorona]
MWPSAATLTASASACTVSEKCEEGYRINPLSHALDECIGTVEDVFNALVNSDSYRCVDERQTRVLFLPANDLILKSCCGKKREPGIKSPNRAKSMYATRSKLHAAQSKLHAGICTLQTTAHFVHPISASPLMSQQAFLRPTPSPPLELCT